MRKCSVLIFTLCLLGFLLSTNAAICTDESSAVTKARQIFNKLSAVKQSPDYFDGYADELSALGNEIVPLLIETLQHDDPKDKYRRRVSILALSRMRDDRIVPALKADIARDKRPEREELAALLTLDPGDEMADYTASVIAGARELDQEFILGYLARTSIPTSTKMRLYFHYEQYSRQGKHSVIRGLQMIDDKAAFEQLSRVLLEGDIEFRGAAARALGNLCNSDPREVLLEGLKKTSIFQEDAVRSIVLILGDRRYTPVVQVVQRKLDTEAAEHPDDTSSRRFHILAAGLFARFGIDYGSNAKIIRDAVVGKEQWLALTVAGWLDDDDSVRFIASQLDSEAINYTAISALGKSGSRAAVSSLRTAMVTLPMSMLGQIGDALAQIGLRNNDREIITDSDNIRHLLAITRYLGSAAPPQRHEIKANIEGAAALIRKYPALAPKIAERDSPNAPTEPRLVVMLLDKGWTPAIVPYVEEIVRTDTYTVSFSGTRHYQLREDLAKLLSKKTGREYTYLDADGTIRSVNDKT